MSLAQITAVHAMKCQQEGRKTGGFSRQFQSFWFIDLQLLFTQFVQILGIRSILG